MSPETVTAGETASPGSFHDRAALLDWPAIAASMWAHGYAVTTPVLAPSECRALAGLFDEGDRFRSRVDMARHRFGEGEYRYFAAPLPGPVQALREALFPPLAAIANAWMQALDAPERYPDNLPAFLARCHAAGQTKPTPLLLRYVQDGYNCLHQDLYGAVAFPVQVMAALSRRDVDYTGGEFLLVEQRPRAQSRGEVVRPDQGELVIFTTGARPAKGRERYQRVTLRHGVSRIRSGTRLALGIIFHDAR